MPACHRKLEKRFLSAQDWKVGTPQFILLLWMRKWPVWVANGRMTISKCPPFTCDDRLPITCDEHQHHRWGGVGWGMFKTTSKPAHVPHHHQHGWGGLGYANVQSHSRSSSPSAWVPEHTEHRFQQGAGDKGGGGTVSLKDPKQVFGPCGHTASEIIVLCVLFYQLNNT